MQESPRPPSIVLQPRAGLSLTIVTASPSTPPSHHPSTSFSKQAFISLEFAQQASFQLGACLLVLLIAYSAHVGCSPYMGPADFEDVSSNSRRCGDTHTHL